MKTRLQRIMCLCAGLILLVSQSYANEPVSTSYWSNTAIGGHDTVDYHLKKSLKNNQGDRIGSTKTAQGKDSLTVTWQGAKWQFATQTSADKFAADPSKYAPRYNGHCANALSLGEGLIPTSGKVWEFFGDDLHLFYAERGRQRWLNGDWKTYQTVADKAWQQELN